MIPNVLPALDAKLRWRKWSALECRIYHNSITNILPSNVFIWIRFEHVFLTEVWKVEIVLCWILFCPVDSQFFCHSSFHSNQIAIILNLSYIAVYSESNFGWEFWGCLISCLNKVYEVFHAIHSRLFITHIWNPKTISANTDTPIQTYWIQRVTTVYRSQIRWHVFENDSLCLERKSSVVKKIVLKIYSFSEI